MRRKIMTAFVCAIMTISVIPVYADDTQTDQAVTTEVSTETAATVQETKRTQRKEQQKKKTTSKKYTKTKKVKSKKKAETNKVVPMPTQVISKSSSDTIEGRIKDKQAKVKQLKKQKAKIQEEIRLEQQKFQSINEFYKKYTANSKAEIALYGQEITPSMKISKKDEQLREDLYELADLFGDENLRTIASEYVFGINHPDFETLLDKNETIQLDQYLKNEQILPIKPMEEKVQTIKKQIKKFKEEIKKEEQTRYFNPNDVSALSHITVADAKHMLEGTALYENAKSYVKAEEKYHVNAVFLMGIAAHESAWGTSRRAREDNNLTGYGVTSDHAKGINKSTKEAGLLATAETLHEKYLTPGGSYYVGTSAAAVNKHYCVGGEWAAAVVKNAYLLMERL
ncbi:glucosaminidase domain-containing protein [Anaerostipes hadrus]|uniref:glucosaminidase domain-containing protein n=1 Tax=Anaerostipes hadrus TaxID=649756 RepID=UPI0020799A0F|nr:glucosaminidase domain-containing protein [Anaerostipes hadrus]